MRKLIVGSLVIVIGALAPAGLGFAEKASAPRGELRVVDKSPFNWIWITLNVFEQNERARGLYGALHGVIAYGRLSADRQTDLRVIPGHDSAGATALIAPPGPTQN